MNSIVENLKQEERISKRSGRRKGTRKESENVLPEKSKDSDKIVGKNMFKRKEQKVAVAEKRLGQIKPGKTCD